ncbi:MAG: S-adenosylmethionine:tRNA ribosyltransferase-isomerase [Bacteroidota bacterium]
MPHPKDLLIADFTYGLPDEKIAKYPLAARDASRLLLYDRGSISETVFGNIADQLPANALLVFNNSKVIQSRLGFTKPSGGMIEIFILEPCEEYGDITAAMKTEGSIRCNCLVGGAKKWKTGKLVLVREDMKQSIGTSEDKSQGQRPAVVREDTNHGEGERDTDHSGGDSNNGGWEKEPWQLTAEMISRNGEEFAIEFQWKPAVDFATALELFGNTPIPPYLQRASDETDKQRYQNIYAKEDGSVAAPTAGLHFTDQVIQSLENKNINNSYITLHVGAGTFKPVKSETIAGHDMHAEFITVETSLIEKLLGHEEVIPVGTTSMRTLESLYWMGVKTVLNKTASVANLEIKQWEVYDKLMQHSISKKEALESLLDSMKTENLHHISVRTQIMIAPGYQPKIATAIITNFHQPQSTLLLLIAALVGDDWKKIYEYALENGFRFLSYGDSSLIRWNR